MLSVLILQAAALNAGTPPVNIAGKVTMDGIPAAGVPVSDGHVFVKTDPDGCYSMSSSKSCQVVFVVAPSGYAAKSKDGIQPGFWHLLMKSPDVLEEHDFVLERQEQGRYGVIFVADAHLCNAMPYKPDLHLFDSLAVPAIAVVYGMLSQDGPVFTFNLGDLSHDRYWHSNDFRIDSAWEHLREAGVRGPVYSVCGNHDHDPAVCFEDEDRTEFEAQHLYRSILGPAWYSVNIGGDHWVVMDNVKYINTPAPGNGIKGVAGKRNYRVCYSEEQMEWLEKDLGLVPDGTKIYICSHAPLFDKRGLCHPERQIAYIDSLAASKGSMADFFAGHVHRMENTSRPEYPHIREYCVPAISGNMWECWPLGKIMGLDGTPGGIEYARCSSGSIGLDYYAYEGGRKYMRAYDMNSVMRYYAEAPEAMDISGIIPSAYDFSSDVYRNCVMVNCWWYRPGDTVEIYEDGRPLSVHKVENGTDPLALVNHIVFRMDRYRGRSMDPVKMELTMANIFSAKASSADSDIVVRICGPDGRAICEEPLMRGKPFSPDRTE